MARECNVAVIMSVLKSKMPITACYLIFALIVNWLRNIPRVCTELS